MVRVLPLSSLSRLVPGHGSMAASPVRRFSTAFREQLPSFHQNQVLDKFLKEGEKKLTLKQLLEFGENMSEAKLITSANFVRKELPVRLAHRIVDFHSLPYIVGTNKYIEKTYLLYWQAFDTLRRIPEIKSEQDNEKFCEILKEMLAHHSLVLPSLVLGLQQSKQYFEEPTAVDSFFRKLLKSRISRRLLAEQQLKLSSHKSRGKGEVGILSYEIHVKSLFDRCYQVARKNCVHTYGECPEIQYGGNPDARFAGVPYHLEYTLYELLKNSMRAVVENKGQDTTLPPIEVVIAESERHVALRISDQGGGVEHSEMKKIWDFSYTTAPRPKMDEFFTPQMGAKLEQQSLEWPMAGTGYGLPISRVFTEFFGGTLELHSIHGHGMDSYVLLKRRAEDQMDRVI